MGERQGTGGLVDGRQSSKGEGKDSSDAPGGSRVELRGGKKRAELSIENDEL